MLPNNLDKSFVYLTQKAIDQLPVEQRRKLNAMVQIEKLTQRIAAKLRQASESVKEVERLKQSIASRQTAEELVSDISDEELMRLYSGRLLNLLTADQVVAHYNAAEILAAVETPKLCGLAVERLLGGFDSGPSYLERLRPNLTEVAWETFPKNGSPTIARANPRKPLVAILGLLPQQLRDLQAKCPGALISVISTGQCPKHAALYVAWTNFINHSQSSELQRQVPADRFVLCSGGLTTLARLINKRLQPAKV
jgi:hypothetical protein